MKWKSKTAQIFKHFKMFLFVYLVKNVDFYQFLKNHNF